MLPADPLDRLRAGTRLPPGGARRLGRQLPRHLHDRLVRQAAGGQGHGSERREGRGIMSLDLSALIADARAENSLDVFLRNAPYFRFLRPPLRSDKARAPLSVLPPAQRNTA